MSDILIHQVDLDSPTPVLDILKHPKNWCKETGFKSRNQSSAGVNNACSCCILGAIKLVETRAIEAEKSFDSVSVKEKIRTRLKEMGREPLICKFNDDALTTHRDVVELLEKSGV